MTAGSGANDQPPTAAKLRSLAALGVALACVALIACTSRGSRSAGSPVARSSSAATGAGAAGASDARAPSPAAADDVPACLLGAEPLPAPVGERTEVFQPPPASPRPPAAATPSPPPELARIVARSAFALYALDAPLTEFMPTLLRVSTVPAGADRAVSAFALQYRVPVRRGGGTVIALSGPAQGRAPQRDDLDDSLDAIRLRGRLASTPQAGDPLADPGAALRALGCPTHTTLTAPFGGTPHAADLIAWPGVPGVQFLRLQADGAEITLETVGLGRDALLALPARLVALQTASIVTAQLQAMFDRAPARVGAASPTPRSGATARPTPRPGGP